jgi:hypothetical protein
MNARTLAHGVSVGYGTVTMLLAIALGGLATSAGFSPLVAMLVGVATAAIGWWAVISEP